MKHLFALSLIAFGPIFIGNGGGSAEFMLFAARDQGAQWLQFCQASPDCAEGIESSLSLLLTEKPMDSELRLLREEDLAGSVFQTQGKAGSLILVNQDRLWTTDLQAFGYPEVFQILIAAWSYQLQIPHDQKALLAKHLGDLIDGQYSRNPWRDTVGGNLSVVQFKALPDLILIEDLSTDEGALSFSYQFSQLFTCEQITGSADAPQVTSASKQNWTRSFNYQGIPVVSINGQLTFTCPQSSGLSAGNYAARVSVLLKKQNGETQTHLDAVVVRTLIENIRSL